MAVAVAFGERRGCPRRQHSTPEEWPRETAPDDSSALLPKLLSNRQKYKRFAKKTLVAAPRATLMCRKSPGLIREPREGTIQ